MLHGNDKVPIRADTGSAEACNMPEGRLAVRTGPLDHSTPSAACRCSRRSGARSGFAQVRKFPCPHARSAPRHRPRSRKPGSCGGRPRFDPIDHRERPAVECGIDRLKRHRAITTRTASSPSATRRPSSSLPSASGCDQHRKHSRCSGPREWFLCPLTPGAQSVDFGEHAVHMRTDLCPQRLAPAFLGVVAVEIELPGVL